MARSARSICGSGCGRWAISTMFEHQPSGWARLTGLWRRSAPNYAMTDTASLIRRCCCQSRAAFELATTACIRGCEACEPRNPYDGALRRSSDPGLPKPSLWLSRYDAGLNGTDGSTLCRSPRLAAEGSSVPCRRTPRCDPLLPLGCDRLEPGIGGGGRGATEPMIGLWDQPCANSQ